MRLTKFQAKKLKKYYIVYRIIDLHNGKCYCGAHKVKFGRENDGYICSSKSVYSMVKRNPARFKKLILARYSTAREADKAETKAITKYNSYKNGYNRSKNGGNYRAHGIDFKNKTFCQLQKEMKERWKNHSFDDYLYSKKNAERRHLRSVKMITTRRKKYGSKCLPEKSYNFMKEHQKKRFSNQEERLKTSIATKKAMSRPEVIKKTKERTKEAMQRPDVKYNHLMGLKQSGRKLTKEKLNELKYLETILKKKE